MNGSKSVKALCSEQHVDTSDLKLVIGASMIPHPEKVDKGGEDAYFMTEDGKFLGNNIYSHMTCFVW